MVECRKRKEKKKKRKRAQQTSSPNPSPFSPRALSSSLPAWAMLAQLPAGLFPSLPFLSPTLSQPGPFLSSAQAVPSLLSHSPPDPTCRRLPFLLPSSARFPHLPCFLPAGPATHPWAWPRFAASPWAHSTAPHTAWMPLEATPGSDRV
jgi:hypothetical protein